MLAVCISAKFLKNLGIKNPRKINYNYETKKRRVKFENGRI